MEKVHDEERRKKLANMRARLGFGMGVGRIALDDWGSNPSRPIHLGWQFLVGKGLFPCYAAIDYGTRQNQTLRNRFN
jgi:hypothetical protein